MAAVAATDVENTAAGPQLEAGEVDGQHGSAAIRTAVVERKTTAAHHTLSNSRPGAAAPPKTA
jgi:hypothetical protein